MFSKPYEVGWLLAILLGIHLKVIAAEGCKRMDFLRLLYLMPVYQFS